MIKAMMPSLTSSPADFTSGSMPVAPVSAVRVIRRERRDRRRERRDRRA
eukprot:CAMPEP_0204163174 /NCGR_PEP_ID=MMETSP0361-20130328/36164_1 /ASSEMBLY_ACC=CAM_ASM_000343 /TAXON_ID=268821 /ORGANISM="Scrippsiella Hangoei, Strain SHTV-5" /LENGTH=48 /DNA_ID= /DNA_START= /DNA_END= /DNA_ORIENTATION=